MGRKQVSENWETATVGEAVCIIDRDRWMPDRRITRLQCGTIERLTKTQIVAFDGRKFDRKWGREVGGGDWSRRDSLERLTDDVMAEAKLAQEIRAAERDCRIAADRLNKMRGDDALRIAALLPDELTKQEASK